MEDVTRRSALKLTGAAGAALLAHAAPSAAAQQEKAADSQVIFGVYGHVVGDDWIMEANCRHPSDVNQACDPNCSALVPRHCILRLRLLFRRCRDLPGRPRIWRVVLRENCPRPAKLAAGQKRNPNAPYFIEQEEGGPEEGVDIEIGAPGPRR